MSLNAKKRNQHSMWKKQYTIQGTLEELKKATGVCGECEACKENLTYIMKVVCGCNMVTFDDVKNQLDNGLNTFEEISKQTKAGTTCGHCKALVENIIKQGY